MLYRVGTLGNIFSNTDVNLVTTKKQDVDREQMRYFIVDMIAQEMTQVHTVSVCTVMKVSEGIKNFPGSQSKFNTMNNYFQV